MKSEEVNVVVRELERLLNGAAEAFDAPDMAQVALYLAERNVVVLPCRVGDRVYAVADIEDENERTVTVIEELTVTEVGTRRIFCSSYVPPGDDVNYEIPISEIGVSIFFARGDAERRMQKLFKASAVKSEK